MAPQPGYATPAMKKPARSASKLVRDLFDAIDDTGLSAGAISTRTGVHSVTLSNWKHGKGAPRLTDFENVAQALGYRVVLLRADAVDRVDCCDGQKSTNGAQ